MSYDFKDPATRAAIMGAVLSSSEGKGIVNILNSDPEKLEKLKAAASGGDTATLKAILTELFAGREKLLEALDEKLK